MANKKALIAMSGGVDSSVAAYLMQQRGFDCTGVTMKLFANEDIGISSEKTCCSLADVEDARSVARVLDMPYYVFNFSYDFKRQVIGRFIEAYQNGATPNPCIDCNRFMKFDKLLCRARQLGMDYVQFVVRLPSVYIAFTLRLICSPILWADKRTEGFFMAFILLLIQFYRGEASI